MWPPVAGSYKHSDDSCSSIEGGESLDWLSILLAFEDGLCSMQLVGK
jgi:hypothetical protein